jgi:hypothetical protein
LEAYFKVETLLLKAFTMGKKAEYKEKAELTEAATEKFRKENPKFADQVNEACAPPPPPVVTESSVATGPTM